MVHLIPINEFAKQLKKPTSTVRTWKTRGNLPDYIFKKIGNAIYIIEEKFNDWVDNSNNCCNM